MVKPKVIIKVTAVLWVCIVSLAMVRADGEEIYKAQCLKCHGTEGKGDGPTATMLKLPKVGNLSDKESMKQYSDEDLFKIITEGGSAFGKSKVMPSYKNKLSEDEIRSLMEFLKTLTK